MAQTLSQDICAGLARPTNTHPASRLLPSLGMWGEMEGRREDSRVDRCCNLECPLLFLGLLLLSTVLVGWDTPWSLWPSCPMGRREQLGSGSFFYFFFFKATYLIRTWSSNSPNLNYLFNDSVTNSLASY